MDKNKKRLSRRIALSSISMMTPIVAVSSAVTICVLNNGNETKQNVVRNTTNPRIAPGVINAADIDSALSTKTNVEAKDLLSQYSSQISTLVKNSIEREAVAVNVDTSNILTINNEIYIHYRCTQSDGAEYGNDVKITGFVKIPAEQSKGTYTLKSNNISINFHDLPKNSIPYENLAEFNNLSGEEKLNIINKILKENVSMFVRTQGNVNENYNEVGSSILAGGDGSLGSTISVDEATRTLQFSVLLNVEDAVVTANVVINNVEGTFGVVIVDDSIIFGLNFNELLGACLCIGGGLIFLITAMTLIFKKKKPHRHDNTGGTVEVIEEISEHPQHHRSMPMGTGQIYTPTAQMYTGTGNYQMTGTQNYGMPPFNPSNQPMTASQTLPANNNYLSDDYSTQLNKYVAQVENKEIPMENNEDQTEQHYSKNN